MTLNLTQQYFCLSSYVNRKMDDDIKQYLINTCFGSNSNRRIKFTKSPCVSKGVRISKLLGFLRNPSRKLKGLRVP